MKIAVIAHTVSRSSGVPRCVAELIANFSKDHEVTAFAESVADLDDCRFRFVRVPTLSLSRLTSYTSFMVTGTIAFGVAKVIQRSDFDIVHSTIGSGLHANVVTWHFCQEAEWDMLRKGIFNSPRGLSRLHDFDYDLYRFMMRRRERGVFGKKGPDGLIVVSERMRQDVQRYYGESGREIFVVPNAVDSEKFHPRNRGVLRDDVRRSLGISSETPVILFVGGDWERKGLPAVIASLPRLQRRDTKLLIVGSGDAPKYKELAEVYGVADRVTFVGTTSHVERYFAAADVLAFPSLYEPFGLVVPEAMASGLPIVISSTVGASFLVKDGIDGFIIENGLDEDALVEKLDLLLNDQDLRLKVGANARLTAEKLSWDNVALETMKVYEHVLGTSKSISEVSDAKRSHPVKWQSTNKL